MKWLWLATLAFGDLYEDKVRPLLASRCLACHAEVKAGGLRLDSRAAMLAGGKSGQPAIVPGKPDESLLVKAVAFTHAKLKMPPSGGKLADSEIAAIREWVQQGAPVASTAKTLWSLQPLAKPAIPGVDANVRAMLRAKGLEPNPRADRHTLVRRLYYDLTGLPADFDANPEEPADKLVDRLLASRQFGERWARHWLDVARFGEDDYSGTEPKFYPNAWRYRDWVIEAMNRDMPYDLFLRAQIAGDLLEPQHGFTRANYLGGLGLFGLGPWYYGISQPPQARADERHDRVDMIGRGMLGLTIACARCHDHKYDPISTQDYYALAGVFASSVYKEYPLADPAKVAEWDERKKRAKAAEKALEVFLDQQTEQLVQIFARQTARYLMATLKPDPDLDAELVKRFAEYLKKRDPQHPFLDKWHDLVEAKAPETELRAAAEEFEKTLLAVMAEKKALDDENRENVQRAKFAAAASDIKRRHIVLPFGYQSDEDFNPGADVPSKSLPRDRFQLWHRFCDMKNVMLRFNGDALDRFLTGEWKKHAEALRAEKKQLEEQNGPQYPFLHGIAEGDPWDLNLNLRGNPEALGEVIPRRLPTPLLAGLGRGADSPLLLNQGSGRLQLAEAVSTHPLAARTAVNRIWMHLFGGGLVRTPSNFGTAGDTPGNPQLLDYLAVQFRDSGYSVKTLIREIVLSETYQATADGSASNERTDGENRYFWRMNRRRLDAEAFRDALLAAAGTLDGASYGGESKPITDPANRRRTIYARTGRFRQDETMSLFDFPSASVTCEQRVSTNVPMQKLYFLNSEFVQQQAEALAARLPASASTPAEKIAALYRFALGRMPSARELALAQDFISQAPESPWKGLAQVLFSSNEFAFID